MTTSKQFADKIVLSNENIETKIVMAAAAAEQINVVTKSLIQDKEMLDSIMKLLNVTKLDDILSVVPVSTAIGHHEDLHASYLNLLTRTLLRSNGPEMSAMLRTRFATPNLMIRTGDLQPASVKEMRALYINLLELHGEVKLPTFWERFIIKLQNFVKRVPQTA